MKIEIINKEDFKEYKDSIDRIHLENAYPNGYLIDDDYLTKALKVVLVFVNDRVVGYASISKEKIHSDPGSDFNNSHAAEPIISYIAASRKFLAASDSKSL